LKNKDRFDIAIVGLGYVGLSTAVCFATRGFSVLGIDVDKEKVRKLSSGKSVIHEYGLEQMLSQGIRSGRLVFADKLSKDVANSKFIFVTVGTPSKPDGEMETKYVEKAINDIGKNVSNDKFFQTVIIKSTVLPGTTSSLVKPTLEKQSGKKVGRDIGLCVNPEFLREGSAINDTMNPDALVIGREDSKSESEIMQLYKKFYEELPPVIVTSFSNAEMIKYAVNSFRGVQLSYLNSLANLANKLPGADIGEVIEGFAKITKVDNRYLRPGPGFGGSCLPKDMKAISALMKRMKVDPILLEAALKVNATQPEIIVQMGEKEAGNLKGKKIALLGLAYKGGTDDVRDSPSLQIAEALLRKGAIVAAYDPAAINKAKEALHDRIYYSTSLEESLENSELAIIATDWKEFRMLKPDVFEKLMKKAIVIDTRRLLDTKAFKESKVRLVRIGTSNSKDAKGVN
jgi:UDPglucose 6-dehydrogenase